jgi:phosphate transport system ATP-binding protein
MSDDICIKVRNLNFHYYLTKVLKDINLDFKKNNITAIIGPSGSGKSTLLRCFNRIYELYSKLSATGEIHFNGQNILDPNTNLNKLRREVGMVFQKPTPFPLSIFDNIAFALKLHEKFSKKALRDRVEHALQQAFLWDEVKDKLHNAGTHLSGGQQQRLCIARTIAINPEVLLLDEPTSALDPIATAKVEELILELKQKYSIIMVTHNLKQAKRIADETIFIRQGEIIEHAATNELFGNPQHEETKIYIEDH